MKIKILLAALWLASAPLLPAATNDLTAQLQQGLMDEEANHDLNAAIADYQLLAKQFDQDRQVAATAVYRLGECYRKLGQTNDAVTAYQRVIREFGEQKDLATLSQQNLTGLGTETPPHFAQRLQTIINGPSADASTTVAHQAQEQALNQEIMILEQQLAEQQKLVQVGSLAPDSILPLKEQLASLHDKLATLAASNSAAPSPPGNNSGEAYLLAAQLAGLEQLKNDPEQRARAVLALFPDDDLKKMLLHLPTLQRQVNEIPDTNIVFHTDQFSCAIGPDVQMLPDNQFHFPPTRAEGLRMAQAELHKQSEAIARRVDFITGLQQARLQVLRSVAGYSGGNSQTSAAAGDEEAQEIQRIQTMLQNSPDLINAPAGESSSPPLVGAAYHGWLKVAAFLLDHGADVNALNDPRAGQITALNAAASAGNRAMVELLLSRGANVNSKNGTDEHTPLLAAVKANFQAVTEVLLTHKADVNVTDSGGNTPLHLAAGHEQAKIVQLLLAAGGDPNAKNQSGETPLLLAALNVSPEITKLLLAAGADANAESNYGRTPLSYAAERHSPELVKVLLTAKGDPNGSKIDAPLFCAIHQKDTESAALLLQAGANPRAAGILDRMITEQNSNNHIKWSPLEQAVLTGQLPMVQLLLKYQADPNVPQADGFPPLFSALPHPDIVEALLVAGATVDSVSPEEHQWTPLAAAAGQNYVSAVEILLRHGANPNVSNRNGATPLHWAAYELADPKIFELLLKAKADPNVRSSNGRTPLDELKQRTPQNADSERLALAGQLVDLLRQYGAKDNLPDWNAITVSRPSGNFSQAVFGKSASNWNQFSLLELIFKVDCFDNNARDHLAFADLAHIIVVRPSPDGLTSKPLEISLLNASNEVDCTRDIPLQFGDVVEIPEHEHTLAEGAKFLPDHQSQTIIAYIRGKAGAARLMVAGGVTVQVPLQAIYSEIGLALVSKPAKTALTSSSDLSRVKVTRHDPQTGKTSDWVLDCSNMNQNGPNYPNNNAPDLLLRDGDVINVPEKP